jgi:predicted GIY-YIG superfamily endonuclease
MPFYVYIVRCSDASYYVGQSDDLEKRISDHNAGLLSAYTRKRRPVKLVFSEEFQSREEALARERQLQGWSRAKKEALIAGNWERLRLLSRSTTEITRGAEEARVAASIHSASARARSILR